MLQRAAELHSLDMAARDFFEHRNPDGVHPDARIVRQGYPPILVGENLAWGETEKSTPAAIVELWMQSPGHRRNILEPGYREIGIGMAYDAPEPQERAQAGGDLHDDVRRRRALSAQPRPWGAVQSASSGPRGMMRFGFSESCVV